MQLTSSHSQLSAKRNDKTANITLLLLSLLFLMGSVAGCVFGLPFLGAEPLLDSYLYSLEYSPTLFISFIWFIRFVFISFLMGTSFLGVTLVPLLTFVRGYLLSCASLSIIKNAPQNSIIMALIIIALPALFSIPCYFAVSSEAFFSSRRLLLLCAGRYDREKLGYKAVLYSIPVLLVGALAEAKLIPYILTLLNR